MHPSCTPFHRQRVRPATDIVERPEGILVLVNLPGVAPENLSVTVDHHCLCVRSARPGSGDGTNGQSVLALEFVDREYEIKITLPPAQDLENIEARLKDGVLSLLLPRRRSRGPRVIPVAVDDD